MNKFKMILEHCFWTLILYYFYINIVFKCIPGLSAAESKLVLWGAIICLAILVMYLAEKKKKYNSLRMLLFVSLPYGVYTIASYISVCEILMKIMLIIGAALIAIFVLLYAWDKKSTKSVKSFITAIVLLVAIVGLLATGFIIVCVFADISLPVSTEQDITAGIVDTYIDDDPETISNLAEEEWKQLTLSEKKNILQLCCNIERTYWGLPYEVVLQLEPLEENLYGYYNHNVHTVVVNLNLLEYGLKGIDALNVVIHECTHSYQHAMAELYNSSGEMKTLRIFESAIIYLDEIENYEKGGSDFDKYYNQQMEKDARENTELRSKVYMEKIEEFSCISEKII